MYMSEWSVKCLSISDNTKLATMFALQRMGIIYPEVIPRYGIFHSFHARYMKDSVNWLRMEMAIMEINIDFKRL